MVNIQAAQLDLIFYALSDSTRRQILVLAGKKTCTVSEIAKPFKMSLAAVSKHIKILEKAKLLRRKQEGRTHYCTLESSQLKTAEACIQFYSQFWNERLNNLEKNMENLYDKRK